MWRGEFCASAPAPAVRSSHSYNDFMLTEPIQFDREIPLFPLPNCVLFPGTVQPLHIFEPRYRAMMRDVVAGQGVMAMGLLKPGWEKLYHSSPPIYARLCAGRVIAHEEMPDGKFNLLLQGVTRANVQGEGARHGDWGVYRAVTLKAVPERPSNREHEKLQRELLREMFERTALRELTVTPALAAMLDEPATPETDVPRAGRLIDAVSFALVQDVAAKQRILEEDDIVRRGELLMRELASLAQRLGPPAEKRRWPPPMGVN